MIRAAITIDLDGLAAYHAIHGLRPPAGEDPILTTGLARFLECLERAGASATIFAIGRDAAALSIFAHAFANPRIELASHSFAHDYRLSTYDDAAIRKDLEAADAALRPLSPRPLQGFRAPGYNTSPALLRAVAQLGYRYDSSLLPSPWYWLARGGAIGAHALAGRRSRSLIGDARAFAGPLGPHRIGFAAPWLPTHGPLLEFPIAVDPLSRLPLIGTTYAAAPKYLRERALNRALAQLPFLNFELHAIDFVDQSDHPQLAALARFQRDLVVRSSEKLAAYDALFRRLSTETELASLAEHAAAEPPVPRP